MVDDPTDEDYKNVPRRGIRKRITTKRQKALLVIRIFIFCQTEFAYGVALGLS